MAPPEVDSRDLIATELHSLIEDAIGRLRRMAGLDVPLEPKGFAAYLRATNALLDHIDGLVRLKEWSEDTGQTGKPKNSRRDAPSPAEERSALVDAARQALAGRTTETA